MINVSTYRGTERRLIAGIAHPGNERRNSGPGESVADRERELVRQATQHNQAAFSQLYDRHVDRIFKYTFYRVGNRAEAEDLTEQVFLKAWQAIGQYQYTERPFAAWLYRIAHNLIVDHFRTAHHASSLDEVSQVAAPGSDLDEIVDHHLTAETVRRALRSLTHDQQQVIVLRFLEGYAATQVAQIMGRESGAVRALQHRALVRLNGVFRQDGAR